MATGDRMPDAVVVDIDDTLYLEREYVASGFAAVGQAARVTLGVDGFAGLAWDLFCQGTRGDIFNRTLATLGIRPAPPLVAELVKVYREHRPRINLLPDARRALDDLRRRRVPMAVLSDGPEVSQAAKATVLGLDRYTRDVVLTGRYGPGYGKPHPRGFQELAGRWSAHRLVYVADNPAKDFLAPHRLGWSTIRVRRPDGLHAHLPDGDDVDVSVRDLCKLDEVLASVAE